MYRVFQNSCLFCGDTPRNSYSLLGMCRRLRTKVASTLSLQICSSWWQIFKFFFAPSAICLLPVCYGTKVATLLQNKNEISNVSQSFLVLSITCPLFKIAKLSSFFTDLSSAKKNNLFEIGLSYWSWTQQQIGLWWQSDKEKHQF